jgi:tetratricopeptide (TPR) repeat protein
MMRVNMHLADVAKDLKKYLVKKANEKEDFYRTQIEKKDPELLTLSEKDFLKKVIDAGDTLSLNYKKVSRNIDTRRRVLTAQALFRLKKTAQAAELFEAMLDDFPGFSPQFILPAIQSFHQSGKLALAQKWMKTVLAKWPNNKSLRNYSALIEADVLGRSGRNKEAEALLDETIEESPSDQPLLQAKAFLEISRLLKSGKIKEAKEKTREAIKRWPENNIFITLKNRLGIR